MALMAWSLPGRAEVVINEIMASNTRAFPDVTDFEDYPDWLELKNTGDAPVSLAGYFLSDDPSKPLKWQLPARASIPAYGFLVIVADGHDAAPGQTFPRGYWPWKNFITEKYHANFSLAAGGETITLGRAAGVGSISLVNASSPTPTPPASVAVWKYMDTGADLGTQWRARNFDDSGWAEGPAELGYGDSPATTVSHGPSSSNKHITTYFRHHFTVAKPAEIHGLTLRLLVDDGCVVYLNGAEVARRNLAPGAVGHTTLASDEVNGADETTFFTYNLPATGLVAGDNVLAVEVHQASADSSDLSFDLGLEAWSHTGYAALDTVSYSEQVADVPLGRDAANPAVWRQFAEATPGADNTAAVVDDLRQPGHAVSFSLPGGLYSSAQTVSLAAPGGVIHYTLDGQNPKSSSPVYSGPIQISATTVLRARCFEPGKAPGPIATATYFLGETQGDVPIISVVADPETLFGKAIGIYANQHESVTGAYGLRDVYKGKSAPGNVEFFGPAGTGSFSVGCGIRIGGENNWVHPQKALNFAVSGKYGSDDITFDLFPGTQIPVHSAFTLRDGGDNWNKDMLRDCLFPKLAHGHMSVDTADYRPSVVFINGAYYGLHDIRQRWDETWFAQTRHIPADRIDHLLYGHITSSSTTLGADKGDTADWLDLLRFLNTADLTLGANWAYVESKIDIDSFIDFVVAESYGNNTSWHHNREFWKEKSPGAKWRWFLTDMDRTFSTSTMTGVLGQMLFSEEVLVRLKTNLDFKHRLAQRYAAHMAGTFKASRVQSIVSRLAAEVADLVPRHAARWAPYGTTVATRDSHIQQIKDYATQRAANFHSEVALQLGLGAAVDFTLGVDDAARGSVLVEGVPVEASTFKMFPYLPFSLKAVPAPGYVFSGWSGAPGGESISVTLGEPTTLTAHFIPSGETVVGGVLPGDATLGLAGSPYAVASDLVVPAGATLTIEAGVELRMAEGRNIRVLGALHVRGTGERPVRIQARGAGRWGGLSFEEPSAPSTLSHLTLRHATKGRDATRYSSAISGRHATVDMDHLEITECESPIYMFDGTCSLRDSVLHNPHTGDATHIKKGSAVIQRCVFLGNNAPDTDGIDFDGVTSGRIEDCRIYRFQGSNSDGIDIGEQAANVVLEGNLIYFNSDKGVSVGQGSSVLMRRNLIVGCVLGVGIKDAGSLVVMEQNTLVSCETGVAVYEKNFGSGGGAAIISDTIISRSSVAPVTVDGFSTLSASYCLSDTLPIPGLNNLFADPAFADPAALNFQLLASSPAIDAGDPAHAPDPDATRADIGARYSHLPANYPYTIGETVVVNELLANSGSGSDWIELHNRTQSPVEIGGWFLSDSGTNLLKYRIPLGATIPGGGYLVFHEDSTFGAASVDPNKITPFALSDTGETVYLSSARGDQLTDYRTKEDFGPSSAGEILGSYYKASSDSYNFVAMETPTPGAPNSLPRVGPIVISEIMYNPGGSGTGDAEYIELVNVSPAPVTLHDDAKRKPWRVSDGINFEFPSSPPLTMAPGERILLVKNLGLFTATYGALVPPRVQVFEWVDGSLSNGGEQLQLDRPGPLDAMNEVTYVREDRVKYGDSLPWPPAADGHGPSLAKVAEREYGNDHANWVAANPTPGAPGSQSLADSDGDGMPNDYERDHNLNPDDPRDAALDADGDGQSNLDEYLAGTNPRDPADSLRATALLRGGLLALRFTAAAGKTYSVQFKAALADPAWTTLLQIPAQDASRPMEVTDPSPSSELHRYYRVVTPRQP